MFFEFKCSELYVFPEGILQTENGKQKKTLTFTQFSFKLPKLHAVNYHPYK